MSFRHPLLLACCVLALAHLAVAERTAAPQPLFRDPVFDGAADPVVIWNPAVERWWMFYTNRRANVPGLSGVAWVHGTRVSIAESADRGVTWTRLGDAEVSGLPADVAGEPTTHWAPEVLTGPDGTHHMYLTVVPGVFENWQHPRRIVHLTSPDLRQWTYRSTLDLASDRVIDAGVAPLPGGGWRLWYNNERDAKSIYFADSPDLYTWTERGKVDGVGERPGEGPYVFAWRGSWWMLVDLWKGIGVYRSDDLEHWTAQSGDLVATPGRGPDDGVNGGHPGVVVCGDRAYLFYFTHPGRAGTITPGDPDSLERRRSSILVTELFLDADGRLTCDRDAPTFIDLVPPASIASLPHSTQPTAAAFAGSTINAPVGFHQSLVSNATDQYYAFYDPAGQLVIAQRRTGAATWTLTRTAFSGNVNDAHNTIALGLDGTGALHLAWGHHNIPLNYARSTADAPLTFGALQTMLGRDEQRVTYPQFLTQPDGNLLFLYRDGGSGRGNLVLNRYATDVGAWTRVHDTLISGEGQRSAYPSAYLDARGTLHLAWVWRDTPDVATNHDLAYARSTDGGVSWTDADGRPLAIPLTAANAAYVARIAHGSDLMNPPTVTADERGRPLIANYWREPGDAAPQYRLFRHDRGAWTRHTLTANATAFQLAGQGTRRPPLSRGAVFARDEHVSFIFRHDGFGGAPLRVFTDNLNAAQPDFVTTILLPPNLGAWEPTADAAAWQREQAIHLTVQVLDQQDGNDRQAREVPPQPIHVIELR